MKEYGFLDTSEFVPKFSGSEKPKQSETVWDRLFYKGLRDAKDAIDYDEAVVRSAIEWLECPPDDKPWVLSMPLIFPHCPFSVEKPYFSMYDRSESGITMPFPKTEDKTGCEPRYMQALREQYGTGRATEEMWQEIRGTYNGMISRLDDQTGHVLKRMNELGLWGDTVTGFFTDHGEYLGHYGLIEKRPSGLSDSLTHKPLIVGGAGLPEGKTIDAMAEMGNLVPTVLECSGIGEHFAYNGKSWVPLLCDNETKHKTLALIEGGFLQDEEPLLEQAPYPYDIKAGLQHEDTTLVGKAISCRDENWTFVYRLYAPSELYNRNTDPRGMHNLAADPGHKCIADSFESATLRWLWGGSDFLPWEKDPDSPRLI